MEIKKLLYLKLFVFFDPYCSVDNIIASDLELIRSIATLIAT